MQRGPLRDTCTTGSRGSDGRYQCNVEYHSANLVNSPGQALQVSPRVNCSFSRQQVAAAEQQSLRWEAYASAAASAVRWHDADKDAAQGDAFGTALAGNTALRPQVTRTAAAAADSAAAAMPAGGFTGSIVITGGHIRAHVLLSGTLIQLEWGTAMDMCAQGHMCPPPVLQAASAAWGPWWRSGRRPTPRPTCGCCHAVRTPAAAGR